MAKSAVLANTRGRGTTSHTHIAEGWDGHYEYCRCGVASGDRINPDTQLRYVLFEDWTDSERTIQVPRVGIIQRLIRGY